MAKIYTISVRCAKCTAVLYLYKKEGGGALIKCYIDMIKEDYTKRDLKCPKCGQDFARHTIIHNRPAHKLIRGKVFVRGHHG
jgi:rRNA maturation protein Nop10